MATKLLKQTQDVPRFRLALDILRKLSPEDADAAQDDVWIEKTSRKVASDTERIDADLKSYKHNLIKESIRVGLITDTNRCKGSHSLTPNIDWS